MDQKTDRAEIDALFRLMHFRGILGVNLHMTDRMFSNDSYFDFGAKMTVSDFSKATFVLVAHKKEHSCWKQIDSQLLERSGKSSIQFFKSMLHHRNIFNLIRHYTPWVKKLPSTSITPISHSVRAYYWSHWMMQDFPILQSCTVCCKTEEIVPITWSHKYRVNKLTSRLRHCNSWDIAEREKRNTIWNFWHPKQRDFRCNLSFWKGEEEHVPGILHCKNKVKRK